MKPPGALELGTAFGDEDGRVVTGKEMLKYQRHWEASIEVGWVGERCVWIDNWVVYSQDTSTTLLLGRLAETSDVQSRKLSAVSD